MAQLEHPGIVPVHETGKLPDGRVYCVMKRVRGQRLDAWAAKADLKARLRLFQRICEAVAFAHARGVLHRDLKPENVMVGEFGEALVMDWGLAKRSTDGHLPGAVAGTPSYMAPEAARGEAATVATDVFGLGALLYALVAGRAPLSGADARDVLAKASRAEAPPELEGPPPVAAICAKAMAAVAADRYQSPTALAEDVGRFLEQERVGAYREPLLEKAARFASRNAVVLSLLTAYLLLRVVLLFF